MKTGRDEIEKKLFESAGVPARLLNGMKTERKCPTCAGQGEIDHKPFSTMGDYRECPECGGSGEVNYHPFSHKTKRKHWPCHVCHDEGWAMYGKDILPCKHCGGGRK